METKCFISGQTKQGDPLVDNRIAKKRSHFLIPSVCVWCMSWRSILRLIFISIFYISRTCGCSYVSVLHGTLLTADINIVWQWVPQMNYALHKIIFIIFPFCLSVLLMVPLFLYSEKWLTGEPDLLSQYLSLDTSNMAPASHRLSKQNSHNPFGLSSHISLQASNHFCCLSLNHPVPLLYHLWDGLTRTQQQYNNTT